MAIVFFMFLKTGGTQGVIFFNFLLFFDGQPNSNIAIADRICNPQCGKDGISKTRSQIPGKD